MNKLFWVFSLKLPNWTWVSLKVKSQIKGYDLFNPLQMKHTWSGLWSHNSSFMLRLWVQASKIFGYSSAPTSKSFWLRRQNDLKTETSALFARLAVELKLKFQAPAPPSKSFALRSRHSKLLGSSSGSTAL